MRLYNSYHQAQEVCAHETLSSWQRSFWLRVFLINKQHIEKTADSQTQSRTLTPCDFNIIRLICGYNLIRRVVGKLRSFMRKCFIVITFYQNISSMLLYHSAVSSSFQTIPADYSTTWFSARTGLFRHRNDSR